MLSATVAGTGLHEFNDLKKKHAYAPLSGNGIFGENVQWQARGNRIFSQILQSRRNLGIKKTHASLITTTLQVFGIDTVAVTGNNPEGLQFIKIQHREFKEFYGRFLLISRK